MKNQLRIMIAEDTLEAREILIEEISCLNHNYEFEIEECESPNTAFNKLSEYSKQGKYFDVVFADIDFQEARAKGGKRDSGFEIINKAFDTCPFTKICTYSGQFRAFDLSDKYLGFVRNGLVVYSFDKSHQSAGERDWFKKGFNQVLQDIERDLVVWDIWENSQKLINEIKMIDFENDKLKNSKKQFELINHITSIYPLIKNALENNDIISINSGIEVYHNILETFCKNGKNNEQIIEESNKNKSSAETIIGTTLTFENRVSSLRILVSYPDLNLFRYGYKLNFYRNKVAHKDDVFQADIANLIYSHLTVCLYFIKNQTSFHRIKLFSSIPAVQNLKGAQNLKEMISFLET